MMIQVERGATNVVPGTFANSPSAGGNARLWLLASLLCSAASPALSQSTAASAAAPAAVADSAPTVDAPAGNTGLEEIVVTATKRETNLQKTPIAISVMSNEDLKKRHVQSLYDLADGAVPSLRVATFEARQSALTVGIRGIVPLDANQPAREQGVGIYIDGIYLGRQHGLNAALFDVERIEVLKGPQGTLFGRNTEGGALSIVTKAPTGVFGVRGLAGAGNYNSYNGELHIDLPEFAGISIKADGVIQHQDATTKNPLAGARGWNYFDRRGGRIAARWRPVDGLTNDLAFDIARDANTPFYSQLLNVNPNGCLTGGTLTSPNPITSEPNCVLPGTAFTGTAGTSATTAGTIKPILPGVIVNGNSRMKTADIGVPQQDSVDKTWGISNTLRYKVSPGLELRSITGYREVEATQWDNSGGAHRVPVVTLPALGAVNPTTCTTAAPCGFSRYSLANLKQNQFSQEFQAVGTVGRFDYVAGLYYFQEHVSDDAATPNSNGIIALTTPTTVAGVTNNVVSGYQYVILDPCIGSGTTALVAGSQPGCRNIDRASEVRSKSYAAYGQLTFNATDALHLTVGGRYTHDEKRGKLLISRGNAYGPVDGDLASLSRPTLPLLTPAQLTAIGYTPLNAKWNRFNPTATIAYDFSDSIHAYAKYATGYRAGGASSRTTNYQAFNPEDIKSYEIGLKTDFLDHRVRLNLAAYRMDRKNSQVDISTLQPSGSSTFNNLLTINAPGVTKIRGFEADLTIKPTDGLTLSAAYAYTYTKIPLIPITLIERDSLGVATGRTTTVNQQFFIVFTPRNAASGAIDYELPVGGLGTSLRFHLDANYAQATQAFDQFATKADSSFIVNGRLSLADLAVAEGSRVTLSLWGRNLLDEQHVFRRDPSNSLPAVNTSNIFVGNINNILGDYGNFNAPRTFGVELAFRMDPPRRTAPYIAPPPPPPEPAAPAPATQTCSDGSVILASDACPPPPPPPPPPPAPERGGR